VGYVDPLPYWADPISPDKWAVFVSTQLTISADGGARYLSLAAKVPANANLVIGGGAAGAQAPLARHVAPGAAAPYLVEIATPLTFPRPAGTPVATRSSADGLHPAQYVNDLAKASVIAIKPNLA
jgi:hypothetical protein